MPLYMFKCVSCGFVEEKFTHKRLNDGDVLQDDVCCKCSNKIIRTFGFSASIGNYTPWRKGLTVDQQATKLLGGDNIETI